MHTADWIQLGVLVVAAAGIIWSTRINTQQQRLVFFADYTKRYQQIWLKLPPGLTEPDFDFGQLNAAAQQNVRQYLRAYFDLCSEQFQLQQRKLIEPAIWSVWSQRLAHTVSSPVVQRVWKELRSETYYDKAFCEWIEAQNLR